MSTPSTSTPTRCVCAADQPSPGDLVGLGLALGVLVPRRRHARPGRQAARRALLHAVAGAVVLGGVVTILVILELG